MERSWVVGAIVVAWAWMALELAVAARRWWRGEEAVSGRFPYRMQLAAAACLLATLLPAGLPLLARLGIPLNRVLWAVAAAVALSAVAAARRVALDRRIRIHAPDRVAAGAALGIEAEVPDLRGGGRVKIVVWCERRRLFARRNRLQQEILWHREIRHRLDSLPLAAGSRWVRERIPIPGDARPTGREGWERIVWRVRVAVDGRRTAVADRPLEMVRGAVALDHPELETAGVAAAFPQGEGPDLPPGATAAATATGWRLEHRPLAYGAYLRRGLLILAVAMAMTAGILAGARMVSESFMAGVLTVFGVVVGLALLWSASYMVTLPWRRVRIELDGDTFRWRVGWLHRGSVPVAAVRGVWAGLWSYVGLMERGETGPEDPRLWLELENGKRYLGVVGLPEDAPMLAAWLRWKLGLEEPEAGGREEAERP